MDMEEEEYEEEESPSQNPGACAAFSGTVSQPIMELANGVPRAGPVRKALFVVYSTAFCGLSLGSLVRHCCMVTHTQEEVLACATMHGAGAICNCHIPLCSGVIEKSCSE